MAFHSNREHCKNAILLITRYDSRYICRSLKRQGLYYFSRKIIECKTHILSNCLPILDLSYSYNGPHLFQTKTTLNIVVGPTRFRGVCRGPYILLDYLILHNSMCFDELRMSYQI